MGLQLPPRNPLTSLVEIPWVRRRMAMAVEKYSQCPARRFKRKFGRTEREERRQLYKEASELMAWANQLEDRLIDQILDGAQVITATLIGLANRV